MFDINKRFEILDKLINMVVENTTPSLFIFGEGGLGKTYTVKKKVENSELGSDDYVFIGGYSTARGLYDTLYDHNGKLIIFDDCDSIFKDKNAVNVLKKALDSYDERKISWLSKMRKGDEYPNEFNFRGRIIFISNMKKEDLDEAFLSRNLTVDLSMTPSEKIERMTTVLPSVLPTYDKKTKLKALEFLNQNKDDVSINFRMLLMITKIVNKYPYDWEDMALYMIKG